MSKIFDVENPDDIRVLFGKAVRKRRQELGISQEELADRAYLHRTYVGDVERGERNISLQNIQKLAIALEISIANLLTNYGVESKTG
jgi:transcriptional regulator with XRE-family HTH domain